MCKVKSLEDDDHVLVSIMRTMCCTPLYHILLYNLKTGILSKHDDGITKVLKDYWCCTDYVFTPEVLERIKSERHRLFSTSRWYFDPSKGIPRDTHNPGSPCILSFIC